jgi:hypothetical protein
MSYSATSGTGLALRNVAPKYWRLVNAGGGNPVCRGSRGIPRRFSCGIEGAGFTGNGGEKFLPSGDGPALALRGRGRGDAIAAPTPVVIVAALSPSATRVDTGAKLADHFRLTSVQHYPPVRASRREVIHYRRMEDGILTRIVHDGAILSDPPGISLAREEFYAI